MPRPGLGFQPPLPSTHLACRVAWPLGRPREQTGDCVVVAAHEKQQGACPKRTRLALGLRQASTAMRFVASPHLRLDGTLLIGVTGVLIVVGLTAGNTALGHLAMALPVVVGICWWRPAYGLALLLGLVCITEQYDDFDTL